ncbi:AIM24 Altered inheritance of mitochondria protein 24 [Candida maltosa Xu316]|uniref:Altered inheritance of mitochondria protein 24, mitochondrial n=1 Tax=Candida maltosa (strain Xu316) TaxID=1245528 RepID=M3JV27_CANMX|nr:putative mitochondrial protein [Candida maltosa Xu316]
MLTTNKPCIRQLSQLTFRRFISINQSSIPTTPQNEPDLTKTTTIPANIREAQELTSYRSLETPEFTALNTPPSIISINTPPSVPIHIRRGSLLSIYGLHEISTLESVRSSLEFPMFWKRLMYGGYVSGYQKLISTTPFSVLVSSLSRNDHAKKGGNKSFANLILDGTTDWAVLERNAIQVYCGNSLVLGMYRIPNFISKKLSKKITASGGGGGGKRDKTGLFSWFKSGYCLISGRGKVGLVGNGSVYNLNLNENEEILINKENLLAISVNGPYDLQNCIVKYEFPVSNALQGDVTAPIKKPVLLEPTTWGQVVYRTRQVGNWLLDSWKLIQKYTIGIKSTSYNYLVGNQEFVKVIGPRNLLLQSNTQSGTYLPPIRRRSIETVIPSNTEQTTTTPVTKSSNDYLNYVTIEKGKGAVFKSTPDFSETVKNIANK